MVVDVDHFAHALEFEWNARLNPQSIALYAFYLFIFKAMVSNNGVKYAWNACVYIYAMQRKRKKIIISY